MANTEKLTGRDLASEATGGSGNPFRKRMLLCLADIRRVKEKNFLEPTSAFSGPTITAPNTTLLRIL